MESIIVSRSEAKALGLKRYFTGKPCRHGHVAERFVFNYNCTQCYKTEAGQAVWRSYTKRNRDKINKRKRIRRANNPGIDREYNNEYAKWRYHSNLNYRLAKLLRGRVSYYAANGSKAGSVIRDLGCSMSYLRRYLERQFQPEMTWENFGRYWVIDHIEPLIWFDLTDRAQFLQACHYTNLQPLTHQENTAKSLFDKLGIRTPRRRLRVPLPFPPHCLR